MTYQFPNPSENIRVITASGNVTATVNDQVIVCNLTTPAAINVTLPSSPYTGQVISVKDGSGNASAYNLTILPATGTIDGWSNAVINQSYGCIQFIYNGTNWSTTQPVFATTTRDPTLQPFSSTSIWNIGIGSGATWETTANDATAHLITLSGTINSSGNGYYQPVFIGQSSDPIITLSSTDTTEYPFTPVSIHVPIGSTPAQPGGGDLSMDFYDLTQPGKMWSAAGCVCNNPGTNGATTATTTTISSGEGVGCWDVTGDGLLAFGLSAYPVYNNLHQTQGNYGFGIGVIRDWEITAGVIKHMLRYSLGFADTAPTGTFLNANIAYGGGEGGPICDYFGPPQTLAVTTATATTTATTTVTVASTTGITTGMYFVSLGVTSLPTVSSINVGTKVVTLSGNVTVASGRITYFLGAGQAGGPAAPEYVGVIPYGSTLGIPSSVDLSTLGLTAGGLMLATCIQTYGMVQRDTTGGTAGITLYNDGLSQANPTFTNMVSDFNSIIVPQLRRMTNQAPSGTITGTAPINGGGTYPPLQPPVTVRTGNTLPIGSQTTQSITANAQTIVVATTGQFGSVVLTTTTGANMTGMILAVGTSAGQIFTIINESAFTITFAASGTSHVFGTPTQIAQVAQDYVWDGTNSLWRQKA